MRLTVGARLVRAKHYGVVTGTVVLGVAAAISATPGSLAYQMFKMKDQLSNGESTIAAACDA